MTNLLGALCIDVLERMLCLLMIVPYEVGKSRVFPCLGIDVLLHCVNVGDIVLPRARRRTPGLLCRLLLGLCALRGGWCAGLAFGGRSAALSLGALVRLLGPPANVLEVLLQHVGRRFPALVSVVASCLRGARTCSLRAPRCGPWGCHSPATSRRTPEHPC